MSQGLVRLSQCMIVKNEEKNIEKALTWGRDIMAEQIVVDTGSTDRTAEIAEQLGAKVFHFEWCNDFAAAKNFAIQQAKGNWIAFLDADEYMSEKDAQKLSRILTNLELRRRSVGCPDIIRSSLVNLMRDGSAVDVMIQDRVFQNKRYIRYVGRIHEHLERVDGKGLLAQYDARADLTIYHTGYLESVLGDKLKRNLEMLKQQAEDEPNNYMTWFYIGQCYETGKDWDKADEAFEVCLKNFDKITLRNYREMIVFTDMKTLVMKRDKNDDEKMRYLYNLALMNFEGNPDADYLLGMWELAMENYQDAIVHMEKGLKLLETYNCSDSSVSLIGELKNVYQNLAGCNRLLGNKNEFVRYAVLSLRLNRYNEAIVVPLFAMLRDNGEPVQAVCDFLRKLYDFDTELDLLFLLKCAKLAPFDGVAQVLEMLVKKEEL